MLVHRSHSMEDQKQQKELERIDQIGFVGVAALLGFILLSAYTLIQNWYVVVEKLTGFASEKNTGNPEGTASFAMQQQKIQDAEMPAEPATPRGPKKDVVIPGGQGQHIGNGEYNLSSPLTIRFDLLPVKAWRVDINTIVSNPPLTGMSPNNKDFTLVASDPPRSGFGLRFRDRGKYVVDLGQHSFEFTRDQSLWQPATETITVSVIQTNAGQATIKIYMNGTMLNQEWNFPLTIIDMRNFSQQHVLPNKHKLNDVNIVYYS